MEVLDSDKYVEEKRRVVLEKMIVFLGGWVEWLRRVVLGGDF